MADKITLVTSTLGTGGAEHSTIRLARGLSNKGRDIDVVVQSAKGPLSSKVPENVNVVNLGASCNNVYTRAVKSILPMVGYIRSTKPSIVIASHPRLTNVVTTLAIFLSLVESKLIFVERNSVYSYLEKENKVGPWLKKQMLSMSYKASDRVVAVSMGVKNSIERVANMKRDKIKVIYNPVVTPELKQLSQEDLSHPWVLDQSKAVVLGVGRLDHQKDFSTLLSAFSMLRHKRDVRLIILGEGDRERHLRRKSKDLGISDSVQFAGYKDNPYKYMSKSDVFVLPSRYEGFGNVLVEALACGCPVVSTDCRSGPSEILENGKWGRLIPTEAPETMARAIEKTLDGQTPDTDLLNMRVSDFELERIVDQYLEVIDST